MTTHQDQRQGSVQPSAKNPTMSTCRIASTSAARFLILSTAGMAEAPLMPSVDLPVRTLQRWCRNLFPIWRAELRLSRSGAQPGSQDRCSAGNAADWARSGTRYDLQADCAREDHRTVYSCLTCAPRVAIPHSVSAPWEPALHVSGTVESPHASFHHFAQHR